MISAKAFDTSIGGACKILGVNSPEGPYTQAAGYKLAIFSYLLGDLTGKRILDIGCGSKDKGGDHLFRKYDEQFEPEGFCINYGNEHYTGIEGDEWGLLPSRQEFAEMGFEVVHYFRTTEDLKHVPEDIVVLKKLS